MTVKELCERYNNMSNKQMKDNFIKENVKITPYMPVLRKDLLADIIAKRTVLEYENYVTEDGTQKDRPTGRVMVNTFTGYILFCRTVIQKYTNLEIDKEHFDTDYDELKKSGLLDILMNGEKSLIPQEEIAEFNTILSMKKNDLLENETGIENFITKQIERLEDLANATLTPLVSTVEKKLDGLSNEDKSKIVEFVKKMDFREV